MRNQARINHNCRLSTKNLRAQLSSKTIFNGPFVKKAFLIFTQSGFLGGLEEIILLSIDRML